MRMPLVSARKTLEALLLIPSFKRYDKIVFPFQRAAVALMWLNGEISAFLVSKIRKGDEKPQGNNKKRRASIKVANVKEYEQAKDSEVEDINSALP